MQRLNKHSCIGRDCRADVSFRWWQRNILTSSSLRQEKWYFGTSVSQCHSWMTCYNELLQSLFSTIWRFCLKHQNRQSVFNLQCFRVQVMIVFSKIIASRSNMLSASLPISNCAWPILFWQNLFYFRPAVPLHSGPGINERKIQTLSLKSAPAILLKGDIA